MASQHSRRVRSTLVSVGDLLQHTLGPGPAPLGCQLAPLLKPCLLTSPHIHTRVPHTP